MNAIVLPDVASESASLSLPLNWVGMCGIAQPILLEGQRITARVDAGVSLDDGSARGIHMSRLYLALEELEQEEVSAEQLHRVLDRFLDSHRGLSSSAGLRLHGEVLLQRPALVSQLAGWKSYPFEVCARQDPWGFHVELQLQLAYSSTCPCSAALARQLIQQRFAEDFSGHELDPEQVLAWLGSSEGIVATPHSQRSNATIWLRLGAEGTMPLRRLADLAEAALGTAVQTAVRRADEQAFALANGQNLMFCEDAARRLGSALQQQDWQEGFRLRVVHAESLHAHDAVAEYAWRYPG
ncbi:MULTISPECIES: GTP cyclohydrolase FolE2 [unclassified Pseudomonas]|uniref:GTP cyclohydrolase FolE2 n=1 Tax=unclassified Pseudomonas TaxID=196821 RepID=UPI00129D98C4|nr:MULTISPECIES: GTP cyclohydrolase FolE2 [unclassified Pseudomonas]MDH4655883.1 GTP cyclohydrolase I FolE2 [Pseudomonas sp. BN606]MRK21493.1 GTP cyclohydrolase I FolE2 [Pseudomonas sp. JG-B]